MTKLKTLTLTASLSRKSLKIDVKEWKTYLNVEAQHNMKKRKKIGLVIRIYSR